MTEAELDELLTRPSHALVEAIRSLASPLIILGAGGKMGPTLAVLARRAADAAGHPLRVVAVSRFTDPAPRGWLESHGVRTESSDLFDPEALKRLPDAGNVLHLVGLKFGTARNPSATWAANTVIPLRVADRYPDARIVALSTGNVYPPSEATAGGSREEDPLTPLGEYANAAVARERLFEFCSRRNDTPVVLLRLFYAVELRYGVLVDIARKVARGEALNLANGHVNCIWQGDANDMALRAFPLANSPPTVWNLCRPETFRVRDVAERLGRRLGVEPHFEGVECGTALLGNSARLCARLGPPPTSLDTMLDRIAAWITAGGRDLGRPTHFEVRDGRY